MLNLSESESFQYLKNSTNFPTTLIFLSFSVIVKTKSVDVNPLSNLPIKIHTTTSGDFK